ncbi:MAG: alpha-hydroxy-acid oxidizing protein [Geodermatophilaceae bacterium]
MSTTVMGQDISLPVIISPTGVQAVHPDGEVAVARGFGGGGHRDGAQFVCQQVRSRTWWRPTPRLFFQMYWSGDREVLLQRTERARAAGAKGLIVTLDWTFSSGRDWGSPMIPEKIDLKALHALRSGRDCFGPRWVLDFPAATAASRT